MARPPYVPANALPGSRVFACTGKEPFATKAKALEVIERRRRKSRRRHNAKGDRREVARLCPYRCAYCHQWHIGGHLIRSI